MRTLYCQHSGICAFAFVHLYFFVFVRIDQIVVKRESYDVLDVDTKEGTVSVLTSSGDTKDDLNLEKSEVPTEKYNAVCQDLVTRFENGEELKVTVQSAMGHETIIEVSAA